MPNELEKLAGPVRPTCRTCAYYDLTNPNEGPGYGSCRRYAPRDFHPSESGVICDGDDWCGEHPDFPKYLRAREEAELAKLPAPF